MQKDEIQKVLDRFRDQVIRQARSNLTRMGKTRLKSCITQLQVM